MSRFNIIPAPKEIVYETRGWLSQTRKKEKKEEKIFSRRESDEGEKKNKKKKEIVRWSNVMRKEFLSLSLLFVPGLVT